jgi:hypothetical protein
MKRRDFLKAAGAAAISTQIGGGGYGAQQRPPRRQGKSMVGYADKPIETVRLGFIGVGARGSGHVAQALQLQGVHINAIADLYPDWGENSAKRCTDAGREKPAYYGPGKDSYKAMLQRDDIDAVVIATPWEEHVRMCVDAMENGKHAFVEVPAALTLEDCWKLVDTSERTKRHCMMMENVNYGREELMVLNMCRLGVFGDLLHGEAAYIHDLRGQMHEVERGTGSWRTVHYQKRNGNLYPTHGLGPVAFYMGVNRGDRFDFLSSVSSNSRVRAEYAKKNFPPDHKWNKAPFVCGDINTSIVRTVNGRTVMVQWDEQLPRPYTRHNLLQGTKGVWGGFPNRCVIEKAPLPSGGEGAGGEGLATPSTGSWTQGADLGPWFERYDHPLWKRVAALPENQGGHGGMDFVMLWRIVYNLRNGLPMDQDVYDAAAWSAVTPLSERSVARRGEVQDFPDFTRGEWKDRAPEYWA